MGGRCKFQGDGLQAKCRMCGTTVAEKQAKVKERETELETREKDTLLAEEASVAMSRAPGPGRAQTSSSSTSTSAAADGPSRARIIGPGGDVKMEFYGSVSGLVPPEFCAVCKHAS